MASKNNRQLQTRMTRADGETGVIGGIYDTKTIERVIGIPFLSSLPILGALFRSRNIEQTQTELLIMVTPTIQRPNKSLSSRQMTNINPAPSEINYSDMTNNSRRLQQTANSFTGSESEMPNPNIENGLSQSEYPQQQGLQQQGLQQQGLQQQGLQQSQYSQQQYPLQDDQQSNYDDTDITEGY